MSADPVEVIPDRPALDPDGAAPPWWEQAAVIGVIVMLTGALIGPVFAPTQEETPILRLIWLPVYAVIAGLLCLRADKVIRAWPAWIIVGLLILHALASKYWSIDAETTQRRTIALAIASAFSIYLGVVFSGRHLPRVMMWSGLLMGVGSLIMVFAFPTIGVHQADNAGLWRGLWYEKNQMGLVMVAGATAAAACIASGDRKWLLPAITLGVDTLLVLATQSKTSLLCLIIGVGVVGAFWAMKRGGPALTVVAVWFGVVVAGVGAYLMMTEPAVLLKALGKDPTLTGRTDIWAALMRRVAEHPWTGYGYQAFWGRESIPAEYVRQETQWPVPSAHNGWIDLLVQLGWPGAVSVGGTVLIATLGNLLRSGGLGAREGWFSLGYLGVFLLLSLSESVLLTNANLPWCLVLAALARALTPDSVPVRVPLARPVRGAYGNPPRIAAHSVHAFRRPLPVR